jgi:hypothetical protein
LFCLFYTRFRPAFGCPLHLTQSALGRRRERKHPPVRTLDWPKQLKVGDHPSVFEPICSTALLLTPYLYPPGGQLNNQEVGSQNPSPQVGAGQIFAHVLSFKKNGRVCAPSPLTDASLDKGPDPPLNGPRVHLARPEPPPNLFVWTFYLFTNCVCINHFTQVFFLGRKRKLIFFSISSKKVK